MTTVFKAPNGDEYDVRLLTARHQIGDCKFWAYYKFHTPEELEKIRQEAMQQLAESIAKQIISMSSIDFETWRKDTPKEIIEAKAYVLVKI